MINGKKIVVVLPAYNAAKTLKRTYDEIPFDIVDEVVLVDEIGGKAFEVSTMEGSMVKELMVEVSMVDVTNDSLLCIPSSMFTCVLIR